MLEVIVRSTSMTTTLHPVALVHLSRDAGPIPEPLLARALRTAQRRVGLVLENLDCQCASQPGRAVSLLVGPLEGDGLVHRVEIGGQLSLYDTTLGVGRSMAIGIAMLESDGSVPDAGKAADAIATCITRAATVTPWSNLMQPGDAVLAAATSTLAGNGSLVLGAFAVQVTNAPRSLHVDRVSPSAFATVWGHAGLDGFTLQYQRDDGDYTASFRLHAGVDNLPAA
jgi:hypothetical protein